MKYYIFPAAYKKHICTMYVQCMVVAEHPEEALRQQRMEIDKGDQKKTLNHQKFRLLSKYW